VDALTQFRFTSDSAVTQPEETAGNRQNTPSPDF